MSDIPPDACLVPCGGPKRFAPEKDTLLSLFLRFEVISYLAPCCSSLVYLLYINNILAYYGSVNIFHIFICKIVLRWKVVKYAAWTKNNGSDIWNSKRIILSLVCSDN